MEKLLGLDGEQASQIYLRFVYPDSSFYLRNCRFYHPASNLSSWSNYSNRADIKAYSRRSCPGVFFHWEGIMVSNRLISRGGGCLPVPCFINTKIFFHLQSPPVRHALLIPIESTIQKRFRGFSFYSFYIDRLPGRQQSRSLCLSDCRRFYDRASTGFLRLRESGRRMPAVSREQGYGGQALPVFFIIFTCLQARTVAIQLKNYFFICKTRLPFSHPWCAISKTSPLRHIPRKLFILNINCCGILLTCNIRVSRSSF